jgi:hypothetical protein
MNKSLTPNQGLKAPSKLSARSILKLCHFDASAQMYDDTDKAFGSKLGDGEPAIREKDLDVIPLLAN